MNSPLHTLACFALLAASAAQAQNQWEIRHDGSTRGIYAMEPLTHRIVALGESGLVLVSDDAHNWIDRSVRTNETFNLSAHGGGKVLAATSVGSVYLSEDSGNSWTRTGTFGKQMSGLASDGRGWLALGDSGSIFHSTDGIHWDTAVSGTKAALHSAASNGTTWVAVGGSNDTDGVVLASDDGLNWEKQTIPNAQGFSRKVIHWHGQFVSPDRRHMRWSADGRHWSQYGKIGGYSGDYMFANDSLLFDGERLRTSIDSGSATRSFGYSVSTVVGQGKRMFRYEWGQLVHVSEDGDAWSIVHDSTIGDSRAIATNGRNLVTTSYYSEDGATWHPYSSWNYPYYHTLLWIDSLYYLGGQRGNVSVSADGIDWKDRDVPWNVTQDYDTDYDLDDVRKKGDTIFAVMRHASWTVDAGRHWTRTGSVPNRYMEWPGRNYQVRLLSSSGSGFAANIRLAKSFDGIRDSVFSAWAAVTARDLDYTDGALMAANKDRFVVLTQDAKAYGYYLPVIKYSDHGDTLRDAILPNLGYNALTAVAWTGTQFVAVGARGLIVRSPDGIQWSRVDSGLTSKRLRALLVKDSILYAVGDSGIVLASRVQAAPVGVGPSEPRKRAVSWSIDGRKLSIRSGSGEAVISAQLLDPSGRILSNLATAGRSLEVVELPRAFRGIGLLRVRTASGCSNHRILLP